MFRVLIVDDEPIICKGLANIINWKSLGCMVCGLATDGKDGIKKIRELKPDIIISDICMPELNGIDMITETRDLIPHSKVIILTGYRDFEYAQNALKLGAFDYILKPSKVEEITEIIKRAVTELKVELKNELEVDNLRKHFEKTMPILKDKLLCDVILSKSISDDVIDELKIYNVEIGKFLLAVAEVDTQIDEKTIGSDKYLYKFGVINSFSEMFSEKYYVEKVNVSSNRVAFIIQPEILDDKTMQDIYANVSSLQELVSKCFDFTITVAVSSQGSGAYQLPEKMEECMYALEHKFYIGNGSMILYDDLDTFFKKNDLSYLKEQQSALINGIKAGNEEQVQSTLKCILEGIIKAGVSEIEVIRNFYWSTLEDIFEIRSSFKSLEQKETGNGGIINIYPLISQAESLGDLHSLLEKSANSVVVKIKAFNQNRIGSIMQKASEYITQNYNKPLTLNDVAEKSYVSTYYLSRMFKKQFNKSFVDFLNEVRIDKAKEYLRDSKYKTYEVGELVGITDSHYFSKLFKKYTGMTASEFRSSFEIK